MPGDPAVSAGDPASPDAPFGLAHVTDLARKLAAEPFSAPQMTLPDTLRKMSHEQWNQLRFRDENTLWRGENLPFEVQFFHPGSVYTTPVKISVVENGKVQPVAFSPDMFAIADPELVTALRELPLDFAGLRLLFPLHGEAHKDEVASFLGATFFRALGQDCGYGLSALGLTVDTASASGEEIPWFREFWLVKPAPGASTLTLYALMDSPSQTGAYTFTLTPGEKTLMDVRCTLFARSGAKSGHKLGIAPMSSMFLSGGGVKEDGTPIPEIHNSDGLLLRADNGQWTWTPLENPKRLAFHAYALPNPRGFGLMQRDNVAGHYSLHPAAYDLRPSLWVEPLGDWGDGHLELIEIPSKTEIHNNIIAFWIPESPRIFAADDAQAGVSYAYRLYWMQAGVAPHSLGRVDDTRATMNAEEGTADFTVHFAGEEINAIPADTGLSCPVELPPEAALVGKQLTKDPETGGWTLSFQVKLPKEEGLLKTILPNMRQTLPPLQFRAVLKRGENIPDPLTETWLFDLQR
ncbi:MAG TPA: glucan biosynthesis protein [Candidatus Avidesulfovibrio excrementigallinarum]|nr:glucan biosynthesis protein [Candidatus Avidesulfovibrio excrementigallinarum]